MNKVSFTNNPKIHSFTSGVTPSIKEFAAETNLFSSSLKFARRNGGKLTNNILDNINFECEKIRFAEEAGLSPIIDVRVTRLMPGMYPAIPGWHCDAVPRKDYVSQPDFNLLSKDAIHFACNLSTNALYGVSNTQYVIQPLELNIIGNEPVWRQVHKQVEALEPDTTLVTDGEIVEFTSLDIHRATPATIRGWRMFFRLSYYHKPPIENGVPGQQQVYLLSEENGW